MGYHIAPSLKSLFGIRLLYASVELAFVPSEIPLELLDIADVECTKKVDEVAATIEPTSNHGNVQVFDLPL
jgi:hypothetical protein